MAKYKTEVVKIKETNALDVATALAYLADFGKGVGFYRTNRRHAKTYPGSGNTVLVAHKESLENIDTLANMNPDILVSPMPDDEYIVEFNQERVNPNLIGKLEQEIIEVNSNVKL